MTVNLRTSLERAEINDFIAAVKSSKGTVNENIKLKHSFDTHVRGALQRYNPLSFHNDKDLQCFIYAANTKHDISNSDIYYIETARSTVAWAMAGILLCGAVPTVLCNLFEFSSFTLKSIFTVGAMIGGVSGFYAGLELAQEDIEQDSSWREAVKCVHEVLPPIELSGAVSVEEAGLNIAGFPS